MRKEGNVLVMSSGCFGQSLQAATNSPFRPQFTPVFSILGKDKSDDVPKPIYTVKIQKLSPDTVPHQVEHNELILWANFQNIQVEYPRCP